MVFVSANQNCPSSEWILTRNRHRALVFYLTLSCYYIPELD